MRISDWSSDVCSSDLPPHLLFAARVADARDHRGVVQLVRKDDATRQQLRQRRQCRFVRDLTAGEQERGLLAMEIGKLRLQLDMILGVAADLAGAARSGAYLVQRLFHP